jgi:small subunit ribosomal protein S13
MARIAGIDLPSSKRIEAALTYIYGIGKKTASDIIKESGVSPDIRVKNLSERAIDALRKAIESRYKVEGELRSEISDNIKRLIAIHSYRGLRHKRGLPVRGQRTRTNARSRKGPSKGAIALRKKAKAKK